MKKKQTRKNQKDIKISLPLRHTPEVKARVDAIAAQENTSQSGVYRKIFNAGLESLYGIKLNNNQIV